MSDKQEDKVARPITFLDSVDDIDFDKQATTKVVMQKGMKKNFKSAIEKAVAIQLSKAVKENQDNIEEIKQLNF